jgi:signal transduction histidine kinase
LAKSLRHKPTLGSLVAVLLFAVFALLWSGYAWLTISEHDAELLQGQNELRIVASAYADYAATLFRVLPQRVAANAASNTQRQAGNARSLADFRRALNPPEGTSLSLQYINKAPMAHPQLTVSTNRNIVIARVTRPQDGIAAVAIRSQTQLLRDWAKGALIEGIGLSLITLVAAGLGARLVGELWRREAVERVLIEAKEQADAGNRAKSEFLAAMSHELRTPLNAIIGFSEMMADEALGALGNARYKEYAVDIRTSGRHLLALINDVLDLTRMDGGKGALVEEDVNIATAAAEATRMVHSMAIHGGINLIPRIEANLPILRADQRRVIQILVNLLSNAIKFTPPGGTVTLTISCQDSRMEISVRDTGIGIAPENITKAFERFGQIDSSLARRYEGTGLGLPLSKQLIELHQGSLSLESELGRGTEVIIRFPRERTIWPGTGFSETQTALSGVSGKRASS